MRLNVHPYSPVNFAAYTEICERIFGLDLPVAGFLLTISLQLQGKSQQRNSKKNSDAKNFIYLLI